MPDMQTTHICPVTRLKHDFNWRDCPHCKNGRIETMPRPFETEFKLAVDRLNEAIYAQRVTKEAYIQRQKELNEVSRKYHDANSDVPMPETI